jgi:hypothetical protein
MDGCPVSTPPPLVMKKPLTGEKQRRPRRRVGEEGIRARLQAPPRFLPQARVSASIFSSQNKLHQEDGKKRYVSYDSSLLVFVESAWLILVARGIGEVIRLRFDDESQKLRGEEIS